MRTLKQRIEDIDAEISKAKSDLESARIETEQYIGDLQKRKDHLERVLADVD